MKVISLFSGAGGLDLGFEQAGFEIVFANEFDPHIWATYELNHTCPLNHNDIQNLNPNDIPDADGLIGGPPCQSWSEAGAQRGINDPRGQLFINYIRILEVKKPKFFICENVPGILFPKNTDALNGFLENFKNIGYNIIVKKINASSVGAPQDRERVIFFGIRKDLGIEPTLDLPTVKEVHLEDAIKDLVDSAVPAAEGNNANKDLKIPNHEYFTGGFSSMYMSRNRVRAWDECGYTVQASGRQCQLHPQAPKMEKVGTDKCQFVPGKEDLYRRLTVRECARLQGFPDSFIFKYDKVDYGYKMIGNAVPVQLAYALAQNVKNLLGEQ